MGFLYLDATENYSDPAKTGLKYYRADNSWTAPDSDHKFYDATGGYSVPELATSHAIHYTSNLSRFEFIDGNPKSALTGETVTVAYRLSNTSMPGVLGNATMGWRAYVPGSSIDSGGFSDTETFSYSYDTTERHYTFTMPDYDVEVVFRYEGLPTHKG